MSEMTNVKETKVTKRVKFEELLTYLEGIEGCPERFIELVTEELAALDKKAESARKSREKKQKETDTLTEEVFAKLRTDEFTTINELVKMFNDEEISNQKVTSRLTKLVASNRVEKEMVSREVNGKEKKMTGYRIIETI